MSLPRPLLLTVALTWNTASAATIQVNTTADAIDSAGDCSLREAVVAANTNLAVDGCAAGDALADGVDQIMIPAGIYTLTRVGSDESWQTSTDIDPYEVVDQPDPTIGDLDLLESVMLIGDGSGVSIVRWSDLQDRIFHVAATGDDDVLAELSGLTIAGGHVPAEVMNPGDPPDQQWSLRRLGGGVAVGPGASIKLEGTSGSDEGNSGPPDVHESSGDASLTLNDVVIDGNSSDGDAGGLFSGGALMATNVVFSNNVCSGNGGGLYHEGDLDMLGVGFINNTAEGGGAMFMTGGTTGTIADALVRGNYAVGGGGLSARSLVIVEIVNSTITENTAFDVGGGLYTNGLLQLQDSTVVGNSSGSDAGFGAGGLSTFGGGLFQIEGTIIADNLAVATVANCGCTGGGCQVSDYFTSDGNNLEDIDSCGFAEASDLPSTDPMLMPLADNGGMYESYALMTGSPAIDAGRPVCAPFDMRGAPRNTDGDGDGTVACDIGAFELSVEETDQDGDLYCPGLNIGGVLVCNDGLPGDCDDADITAFPGNPEVCDAVDNDCLNGPDDGLLFEDWYADHDGDTFGDPTDSVNTCDGPPAGYVADNTDCDDTSDAIHPAAIEVCNGGIDDNCDAVADDNDPNVDPLTYSTFYEDVDEDGFGAAATSLDACLAPVGYVADATDCDDASMEVNPAATEICNEIDDDCDTLIDDDDDSVAATEMFYSDGDEDGFGDLASGIAACVQPDGLLTDSSDCDDANNAVFPGAEEICNEIDDDCDTLVDDADDSVTATDIFYADADDDGYGDPDSSVTACVQPDGMLTDDSDCDDGDAAVHPGAEEVKNDIDDDCDGLVDKDDDDLKGCGCDAAGSTGAPAGAIFGLLALGGLVRRRR